MEKKTHETKLTGEKNVAFTTFLKYFQLKVADEASTDEEKDINDAVGGLASSHEALLHVGAQQEGVDQPRFDQLLLVGSLDAVWTSCCQPPQSGLQTHNRPPVTITPHLTSAPPPVSITLRKQKIHT